MRQLNTAQVDFLLPLVVSARFQPIPRVPPVYVGGDPVDLIDYRTVPVFNVGGNTSTAVSIDSPSPSPSPSPPVYVGPVDLIDYRTVPVFNVGGNTSTAVSSSSPSP